MQCECGFRPEIKRPEYTGGKALNQHRQQCDVFWQSIRREMERISVKVHGVATTCSAGEWYVHRGEAFPTKKTLIDWLGSWRSVLQRVDLGVSKPGPDATGATVCYPSADEIASMAVSMSKALDAAVIGGSVYDERRPAGWPSYTTVLRSLGYSCDAAGWRQFIYDRTKLHVADTKTQQQVSKKALDDKKARAVHGFDYRNPIDEKRLALEYSGLAVCQETYQRTGRMVLR